MPQIINTNVMSLNSQRNLNMSQNSLAVSLQRLSSGLRINSAKDDAAGMAISERFTTQIRGMDQAARNANDGISLAQTAEGALAEVINNLQRVRELAVQSSNATNSQSDRDALQAEVSQALSEINRVANQTEFNGVKLLDGSFAGATFQVGANAGQVISVSSITNVQIAQLGGVNNASATWDVSDIVAATAGPTNGYDTALSAGDITINGVDVGAITAASTAAERKGQIVAAINDISDQTGVTASYDAASDEITMVSADDIAVALTAPADALSTGLAAAPDTGSLTAAAVTTGISLLSVTSFNEAHLAVRQIDQALTQVNGARAQMGALQNRFGSVVASLTTTSENLSASRSRIQDADFAKETANLTRAQILQQAGTAMLAQANAVPQNVLSLLRG